MTRNIFVLLLIVTISLTSFSQEKIKGNKVVTIVETNVNPFNKIVIGEKFNVTLVKSDQSSVEIETDENLHDVITFKVKDSTLTFRTTKKITSKKKLNINIKYAQKLWSIETKDNAELLALSAIESDTLILKTYGNSKVAFNLKTKNFKLVNGEKSKVNLNIESAYVFLDLNENSKIEALVTTDSLKMNLHKNATAIIEGDTNHLNIEALDASDFKGENLTANTCKISISNSSDASLKVLEAITIEASGSSEIYLYENPTIQIDKFTDTSKLIKKE